MVDRALAWDQAVLFRDCRIALDLTQAELADALWVGLRSVQHWEMGDRVVPGPVWQLLMIKVSSTPHGRVLSRRVGAEWGISGGKSQKRAEK